MHNVVINATRRADAQVERWNTRQRANYSSTERNNWAGQSSRSHEEQNKSFGACHQAIAHLKVGGKEHQGERSERSLR
jgi:hypothetical protein